MNDLASVFATIAPFLTLALIVLVGVLGYWISQLQGRLERALRHYRQLTSGVRSGSIESVLEGHIGRIDDLEIGFAGLRDAIRRLELLQTAAIQRVGVVRFNPFHDVGGNQSFAVALLDGRDTGVVISGLYGREGTRMYTKPVEAGQSPFPLTDEEARAIEQAQAAAPLLSALQTPRRS